MIGDYLTEINVTSPTGIREVQKFGGADVASLLWDAIEKSAKHRISEAISSPPAFVPRAQLYTTEIHRAREIVRLMFLFYSLLCGRLLESGRHRGIML